MKALAAALHVGAGLALAVTLEAQGVPQAEGLTISGVVLGANGSPLPFSTASLAGTAIERFSNERGEFSLGNVSPGTYHLRVRQLGFAALDTVITLRAGVAVTGLRIVLSPVAFKLATVTVRDKKSCVVPTDISDPRSDFEMILSELRKNADRERLLASNYPFEYRIAKSFDTDDERVAPVSAGVDTAEYRSDERPRYLPGGLVRRDETRPSPNNRMMMIPVLGDIGDPEFLRTHCFTYDGTVKDEGIVTHRIDFSPTKSVHAADVEGSAFLDRDSFVIRRAVFRLTKPGSLNPPVRELEVMTRYREIFPGVTVVRDVNAVQTVVGGPFAHLVRVRETQRLLDYRFLKGVPGDSVRRE